LFFKKVLIFVQRMRFYCRFVCKDNKKVGMLKVISPIYLSILFSFSVLHTFC